MSKYRWIVFDADGTLFDYEQSELNALSKTFDDHGLGFDTAVHWAFAEINRSLWKDFEQGRVSAEQLRIRRFERLAAELDFRMDAAVFSSQYLLNLGLERNLLPGASEVVEGLSQDFGLMLATNGFAEVQRRRFASSSIRPFFDGVVISEEIGFAKPDPNYFVEVFSRLGNPDKAEVLMVGDSLSSDIAGGSGFGIDTCWFNPSGGPNDRLVEPTYEIGQLEEVVAIVETA